MGLTIPAPSLVQALSFRNAVTPFSSDSPPAAVDQQQVTASPNLRNLDMFGVAVVPVVDAVEAREQRTSSSGSRVDRASSFH